MDYSLLRMLWKFVWAEILNVCASFDQKKMHKHLYSCLMKGVPSPFPKMSGNEVLPRPTPVMHKVQLYCICRMPEEYDEQMISCDICQEWFHTTSVRIDAKKPPRQWKCYSCRQ